mmetsp:Transcript_1659/g.4501  ORF Transcript_1659/g.4501 Transcript_1659/m.4501 type:complete len:207 (-) Transcript_1659:911-1531(-)
MPEDFCLGAQALDFALVSFRPHRDLVSLFLHAVHFLLVGLAKVLDHAFVGASRVHQLLLQLAFQTHELPLVFRLDLQLAPCCAEAAHIAQQPGKLHLQALNLDSHFRRVALVRRNLRGLRVMFRGLNTLLQNAHLVPQRTLRLPQLCNLPFRAVCITCTSPRLLHLPFQASLLGKPLLFRSLQLLSLLPLILSLPVAVCGAAGSRF